MLHSVHRPARVKGVGPAWRNHGPRQRRRQRRCRRGRGLDERFHELLAPGKFVEVSREARCLRLEVPREARFLSVEAAAGFSDNMLQAGKAQRGLGVVALARHLRLGAERVDDAEERRAGLLERGGDDVLRAGKVAREVLQVSVPSDAPGVQALEHLGIGHTGCEAWPDVPRSACRSGSALSRQYQSAAGRSGAGRSVRRHGSSAVRGAEITKSWSSFNEAPLPCEKQSAEPYFLSHISDSTNVLMFMRAHSVVYLAPW